MDQLPFWSSVSKVHVMYVMDEQLVRMDMTKPCVRKLSIYRAQSIVLVECASICHMISLSCIFQELEYCQSVVLSVSDDVGVRTVMDELLMATQNDTASLRCAAVIILHSYCQQTRGDYSEYVPQLFRGLLMLFTDTDPRVLHASWDCLNAVTKVCY